MTPAETLSADAFRAALEELGLTQVEAARILRVHSPHRISEWATGKREVPPYVAAHIETLRRCREPVSPEE